MEPYIIFELESRRFKNYSSYTLFYFLLYDITFLLNDLFESENMI